MNNNIKRVGWKETVEEIV